MYGRDVTGTSRDTAAEQARRAQAAREAIARQAASAAEAAEAARPAPSVLGLDLERLGGGSALGSTRLGLPALGDLRKPAPPKPDVPGEGLMSEEAESAIEAARETAGDVATVAVSPARIDQVRAGVAIVKDATSANPTTAAEAAAKVSPNAVAKAAGAPLSGLFAVSGALQTVDGVEQLAEGEVGEGLANTTGGVLSTSAGVMGVASKIPAAAGALEGTVLGAGLIRAGGAAAASAGAGSGAASAVASGLGTVATKFGGGAVIVGGATQLVTGDSAEDRVLGGVKMAAGAAMIAGGPVGTVAGGLVLGAATVYEHRETIAKGAEIAVDAVGDAAEAVVDKADDVVDAVTDKAKDAFDALTPW